MYTGNDAYLTMLAQSALIFRLLLKMTVGKGHSGNTILFLEGKYPTIFTTLLSQVSRNWQGSVSGTMGEEHC